MSIRLLIIEDDPAQIQTYQDVIDQHNKTSESKFEYSLCRTFEQGISALKSPDYDAAIIDLKLSNSEQYEGKTLVESVYKKLRIPIVVYSGSLPQIEHIEENALLKKAVRTERLSNVLSEIISIYNTGITSLLRPSGKVDNQLTEIFWNHLANDLDIWKKHNNPETLLRYILSHFHEYLEIDSGGDFQEYHPSEVFIRPTIKKNSHTGDVIEFDGQFYLILTPACDMVINYKNDDEGKKVPFRKADSMLLAPLYEFDVRKRCLNKKGEVDKSKIESFVSNGHYRYHYLPPYLNKNGFLVDFQNLRSLGFHEKYKTVASISTPFIKDIIARFSNYYSRQGQPTFNQKSIIESLFNP